MKLITPKLRFASADDRHFSGTKKAWGIAGADGTLTPVVRRR